MAENAVEWIMAFTLVAIAVGVVAVYALTVRRDRRN